MRELALVFTDLVDSTRLNVRLGDDTMQLFWDWHDGCSRALLQQFGGRETSRGDGLVAVFDQPEAACLFAIAYQEALAIHPQGLQARVGLHRGPLAVRENSPEARLLGAAGADATGLAKAVCARLMGLAAGGQVLASEAFVRSLPATTAESRSHGHWRLKGLDDPLEVHELAVGGRFGLPPVDVEKAYRVENRSGIWSALAARRCRLPVEVNGFFGRRSDLQAIAASFDADGRLVSVVGTGGIGKTRLALRYAWGWAGAFAGGACFCELSTARDLDGVFAVMARALDVPLGPDPWVQLGDAIAARGRCLVLLDNAEQVIGPVRDAVAHWRDAAPDAAFLVTSRERLAVAGEQTVWLDPLAPQDAADLFDDRARAVRRSAEPGDARVIGQLVQRLDCLPLAIELAAARASAFSPQLLLERLDARFALLRLRTRGGPEDRQATLWATLDWSWQLLTPEERAALAQASTFAGSFDLEAAEAVLGTSALDLLQSLCDKTLVQVVAGGRFRLLQSVRDFAARRLADDDGSAGLGPVARAAAMQRHRRHFASRSEAQLAAGQGVDLDNVVAACRGASEDEALADGVVCLALAWSLLRLSGPFALAIDLASDLAGRVVDARQRAHVLWVLGSAQFAARSMDDARAAAEAGLQAVAGCDDDRVAALLHGLYGEVLTIQGAFDRAAAQLALAWTVAQRAAEPTLRCIVLNARGALAADQGDLAEARLCYEALQREAESMQGERWQACALGNLAVLLMEAGEFDAASQRAERSLQVASRCGDLRWAGNAHCNLGLIGLETGRFDAARHHLEAALSIAVRLGHRALEVTTEANLGLLAEREGRLEQACVRHRRAVAGGRRLGDVRLEAQLRACLVSALARSGLTTEAADALAGAEALAATCDAVTQGLVACSAAEHHAARADLRAAAEQLARAEALHAAAGGAAGSELGRRLAEVSTQVGHRAV